MDLNDSATGAGDIGMDRFLDGAVGVVQYDGGVALVESVTKFSLKIK